MKNSCVLVEDNKVGNHGSIDLSDCVIEYDVSANLCVLVPIVVEWLEFYVLDPLPNIVLLVSDKSGPDFSQWFEIVACAVRLLQEWNSEVSRGCGNLEVCRHSCAAWILGRSWVSSIRVDCNLIKRCHDGRVSRQFRILEAVIDVTY